MKEILGYIKTQENKFAQLRLFEFLKDSSIEPYQRLKLLYCLADFAMGFKDLHQDILKEESSAYPWQSMLNSQSLQEGSQWQEYLKYLETLEIDQVMRFSDFLKFMWSDKTLKTRRLSNNLVTMYRYEADILLKIIIIQAIEAAGSPALSAMVQVSEELRSITNQKNFDFSLDHVKLEIGYVQSEMKHNEVENLVFNIELNPEQKAKALVLVDYIFDKFTECMDGLMHFAEQHAFKEFIATPRYALH